MAKKLLLLLCFVLMFSCARSTSGVGGSSGGGGSTTPSTYTATWTGYGGNVGATNEVANLPSDTFDIQAGPSETGFIAYAAPVVFQDNLNNQFVAVLWANDTELKLVKYSYDVSNASILVKDTDFGTAGEVTFNATAQYKMAYQISLNIESDQPVIYVAHQGGLSQVNGDTGGLTRTISANGEVFRVVANGSDIYYQTADKGFKTDTAFDDLNSFDIDLSSFDPVRQLPIVVTGSKVFFTVDSTAVYEVNATSFNLLNTETISNSFDARAKGQASITNIAKFSDDSAIYITNQHVARPMNEQLDATNLVRYTSSLKIIKTGTTGSNFSTNYKSNLGGYNGDISFTSLAVLPSSELVYLPGSGSVYFNKVVDGVSVKQYFQSPFDWGPYVDSTNGLTTGLVRVNGSDDSLQSVYPLLTQLLGYSSLDLQNNGNPYFHSFFYVTRFALVDTTGKVLSISNVAEDLHSTNDLYSNQIQNTFVNTTDQGTPTAKVTEDDDFFSFFNFDWKSFTDNLVSDSAQTSSVASTQLDDYNSRVILGTSSSFNTKEFSSTSLAAISIAAGQSMVVVSGDDGVLYILD